MDEIYNFSKILEFLKKGERVSREGWNGKGMWLVLINSPYYTILLESVIPIEILPWIGMKTADNKFVPWLASQTDILAEDWGLLK